MISFWNNTSGFIFKGKLCLFCLHWGETAKKKNGERCCHFTVNDWLQCQQDNIDLSYSHPPQISLNGPNFWNWTDLITDQTVMSELQLSWNYCKWALKLLKYMFPVIFLSQQLKYDYFFLCYCSYLNQCKKCSV